MCLKITKSNALRRWAILMKVPEYLSIRFSLVECPKDFAQLTVI